MSNDSLNIENLGKEFSLKDVNKLLSNMPQAFTENRGQLENDEVRFYAQGGGLWFTNDGVWFEIREEKKLESRESSVGSQELRLATEDWRLKTGEYRRVILKQEFVGANPVRPEGKQRLSWNSNFFYGNDSTKWRTDVPNYQEIYYKNIYDGIDLRYYTNKKGLKYDFIVHPGADIHQIRVKYVGIEGLEINNFGNLIINTSIKDIIDRNLFIYQNYSGSQHQVRGRFKILNNLEYGFELLNNYRKQEILVIDPRLEYSTYIGGSNSESGRGIAVDSIGNAYITGWTNSSNFPTTTGINYNGGKGDVFILKLNSMGSELIYSTFIGGGGGDGGMGIAVDSKGNAYVTGSTISSDFPTTPRANDTSYNGGTADVFVLKLNSSGSKLIYSTFIGGIYTDEGLDMAIDTTSNVFVSGYTTSLDFPTTPGAFDTKLNGNNLTGFVFKLNWNGSALIYSTFLGGTELDLGTGIAIDSTGNAFVSGWTMSSDFPTTLEAYDTTYNGGDDAFVLKLDQNGSALLYSTYIGGSKREGFIYHNIAIDSFGNAFIAGITESSDFPTTSNANDTSHNGGELDVFVLKLDQNGSKLIYSTFIGGSDLDRVGGIAVDLTGNAYVAGRTKSSDFPTTADAYDKSYNGQEDVFVLKLNWNGSRLIYSTFLGGNGTEYCLSIGLDLSNNIYIMGRTWSSDFPTTPGAFESTFNGGLTDAYIAKFLYPPQMNITSLSLLKNGTRTNIIYSRLCSYTFRVNITDNLSLFDLGIVHLHLDPLGANIQLQWNQVTKQFSKIFDPNNYITLEPSSNAINNSYNKWTINFNITFNWTYPDEQFHDVQAYATCADLAPAWLNVTEFYRVENDLVFNGALFVTGDSNRIIANGGLVRDGEMLNWNGLTLVYEGTTDIYPPDDELDVSIWDGAGNSWLDSPAEGQPFYIETITPNITITNGYTYVVNLTGIPPECDATNETFVIKIDGDNVTFSNPIPDNITWQKTKSVPVAINITDHGGGVVNGSSVMRCLSTDNGTTWSDWEGISEIQSKVCITPQDVVLLKEGRNNLIKWQAKDSVGHGPDESDEYRILVDTENVTFSNPIPEIDHESITKKVKVGISISDNTSGVDASTIAYAISTDSGAFWTYWVPVIGYENGTKINITLNLTFPNGTANRIRWRAADIAGNGYTISKEYPVIVNTWLQKFIPRVRLLSPINNTVIPTKLVKLSWMLENKNLEGVTYDVYFDTVNPPNATRAMGIMSTSFLIDDLVDGETYYWTVNPKLSDDEGWCVSGVWSFTVNTSVPFPTVTLTHPKNGSTIPIVLPTLVWSVEYEGTEKITFDIYLSSNKDPGIEATSYQKTYYLPETDLKDNTTYYWKIIPVAGGVQGPESEIWSFMIKRDYIPNFGINLTLEPAMVEMEPADMTYIKSMVKNLGELNDTISLSIQIPNDVNLGAIVNEPISVDTAPEGIAVFNLTIITPQDIKKGEIKLTVVAVSEIAPEYGLNVEENATLRIIILGADKLGTDKSSSEIWIIFIIIALVIIFLLIFVLLIKRRKRSEHEPPPAEIVMIKPTVVPTLDKLKEETRATPTLVEPAQETATTVPKLASPETKDQAQAQQQIPQPTLAPKLPPAQSHITESGANKSAPTPTLVTPQPTLATVPSKSTATIQTNQQIGKEKETGKTE